MEWLTHGAGSDYSRQSAHRSRILTTTSGNAQSRATETKGPVDFKKPSSDGSRAVSEPRYQLSVPTLGSNDKQSLNGRLAQHKARRSSHPRLLYDRPYLRNEKYLNYRERKRFDSGPDGKAVWSDDIEESFQNGMPSMPAISVLLTFGSTRSHTSNGST